MNKINDKITKFNPKTRYCINSALSRFYTKNIPSLVYFKYIKHNTIYELTQFMYAYSGHMCIFLNKDIIKNLLSMKTSYKNIKSFILYNNHKSKHIEYEDNITFNTDIYGVIIPCKKDKLQNLETDLIEMKNNKKQKSLNNDICFLLKVINKWYGLQ